MDGRHFRNMAGQQPFMPSVDMSLLRQTSGLLPSLESALGSSQLLLNRLYGIETPLQPDNKSLEISRRTQQHSLQGSMREQRSNETSWQSYSHGINRGGRLPDFAADFGSDRGRTNDYGGRMQRDQNFGNRDRQRESYQFDSRVHSALGKDLSLDLPREKSSYRYGDRYERDEFDRKSDYPSQSYYGSVMEKRKSQELSREERMANPRQQYTDLTSKYGIRKTTNLPPTAQLRPNCYIVPAVNESTRQKLSEKPLGCRTVFISCLPPLTDEFIINEIFYVCGPIERINVNAGKGTKSKKFCHLRFVSRESVETAILFAGCSLVIGDGVDKETKVGIIQVDYSRSIQDRNEFEMEVKARSQSDSKEKSDDKSKFDSKRARGLLEELRKDSAIFKTLQIITQWFERGECTRSTSDTFYSLLNSTHSHIKRLIKERKEHEELVEKEKNQQMTRANVIKQQCEAIMSVFEVASKKKSWDHFTKPQRRNINQWYQLIKDEIELNKEVAIQNRVEVGMDLDDEPRAPPEPIEQPALQMAQESQEDQEGTDEPSQPKKQRLDSESGTDSSKELETENKKLRSQVTSLKAMAEQNTNLLWTAQSYKQQADVVNQQYSDMVKEKDGHISRLTTALQGLQQFLQIVDIGEPQRRMSNLEILVDVSKDDQNVTDMDLDMGEMTEENETSEENSNLATEEKTGEVVMEGEKQAKNGEEGVQALSGNETEIVEEKPKGESKETSVGEEGPKESGEQFDGGEQDLTLGEREGEKMDQEVTSEDRSEVEVGQEVTSENRSEVEGGQEVTSVNRSEEEVTSENRSGVEMDQKVTSEDRSKVEVDQEVTSEKRNDVEVVEEVMSEDRREVKMDQKVTSETRSEVEVEQEVTSENKSEVEVEQEVTSEGSTGSKGASSAKGRKRKKGAETPQRKSEITEDTTTEACEDEKPVRRATRRSTRATRSRTRQEETTTEIINKDEAAPKEEASSEKKAEHELGEEDEGEEEVGIEKESEDKKGKGDEGEDEDKTSEENSQENTAETARGDESEDKQCDEEIDDETAQGKPRFVEIDEEQFEVIDDTCEDSDDEDMEVSHDDADEDTENAEPEREAVSQDTQADEPRYETVSQDTHADEPRYEAVSQETPDVQPSYESQYAYDQAAAAQHYYQAYSWPSSALPTYTPVDYGPSIVRLSGQELVLVGVMCSYLHVCPSGATSDEITEYLRGQFKHVQKDAVESLLSSLSVVFKGNDRGDGSKKWKFCGFEMARWIGGSGSKNAMG